LKSLKVVILAVFFIVFSSISIYSQDLLDINSLYISFSASYMELKDQINLGFVFIGPDAAIDVGYMERDDRRLIDYTFSTGGGGKKYNETMRIRGELSPVDFTYSFNIFNKNKTSIYIGPSLNVKYGLQSLPDMHGEFLSWMTNYTIGFNATAFFQLGRIPVKFQIRNSLFSLTSRPEIDKISEYSSQNIWEFISNSHSNMQFSTFYQYLETGLSAELMLNDQHSLALEFQYNLYFEEPEFEEMFFTIFYTFYFKGVDW